MIKQKITYHKNNVVYQYIETYNNSISHIAEYDENGCIVYEEFPFFNEWTTWKRDENGYVKSVLSPGNEAKLSLV